MLMCSLFLVLPMNNPQTKPGGRKQYIGLKQPYKVFLYLIGVVYIFIFLYTLITAYFFPELNVTLFWTPKTFPLHLPFEWVVADQILILIGKKFFKE